MMRESNTITIEAIDNDIVNIKLSDTTENNTVVNAYINLDSKQVLQVAKVMMEESRKSKKIKKTKEPNNVIVKK